MMISLFNLSDVNVLTFATFDNDAYVVTFDKAATKTSDFNVVKIATSAASLENRLLPSNVVSVTTSRNKFCVAYVTP